MSMLPVLISLHAGFSTFPGNGLSFREEDELVLFLVSACLKKHSVASDLASIVQVGHFLVNRRKGVGYKRYTGVCVCVLFLEGKEHRKSCNGD